MCAAMAAFTVCGSAGASLCEAPFMHDGGQAQMTGTGEIRLGADLSFSEVRKNGASCEARVQGVASYGLGGLPAGKTNLNYLMTVKDGKATFARPDGRGGSEPVNGRFDLRMLGLFAYAERISRPGQTFPALKFQINVDRKAVQADPIVVRTGEKKVGSRQTISTVLGEQACWPIRYTRVIEPTRATFSGLTLPVPGMTSQVTDWFCPQVNMVMKQESEQSGVMSVIEVTKLR
jgi:hypothetical protein